MAAGLEKLLLKSFGDNMFKIPDEVVSLHSKDINFDCLNFICFRTD